MPVSATLDYLLAFVQNKFYLKINVCSGGGGCCVGSNTKIVIIYLEGKFFGHFGIF